MDVERLEQRGSPERRRELGSWFTPDDVSDHIARSAIVPMWIELAIEDGAKIDPNALAEAELRPGQLTDYAQSVWTGAAGSAACQTRLRDALRRLRVLDPCTGAGAFLLAAWRVMSELAEICNGEIHASQLVGIDVDQQAAQMARERVSEVAGPGACIIAGDATGDLMDQLVGHDPVHVVCTNPPWSVRARDHDLPLRTAACPNVYAHIAERSLQAVLPSGRVALVLPISSVCTPAFAPLRQFWDSECDRVLTSHFDTIPASLFEGVVQRLAIVSQRKRLSPAPIDGNASWATSPYHRFLAAERADLLAGLRLQRLDQVDAAGGIPKLGSQTEIELLKLIDAQPPLASLLASHSDTPVFYKRRWSYFLLFLDSPPPIYNEDGSAREASECKLLHPGPDLTQHALIALLSSSLFWWRFSVLADNRNVNRSSVEQLGFSAPGAADLAELDRLGRELMALTHKHSALRTCTYRSIGTILNTYYRQGPTRPVLDEIDRVLAHCYRMTEDQIQFVLDFERRFRS